MKNSSKNHNIAGLLSAATCSLLGVSSPATAAPTWDVESAILIYSESNSRISAVEPVVLAKTDLGDDEIVSLKLVLDTLTGASATGAVPSTRVQTFTRPSGIGQYAIAPNQTPMDNTFHDTRASLSINWDKPVDHNNRRNLGFVVSREYDFLSVAGNLRWQHDLNTKNTSLTTGINLEADTWTPEGGIPIPLTTMTSQQKGASTDTRNVVDLLFGVTQVIDQSSLFQVNLSFSDANGYLTDPFKFVSVVDSQGEPIRQLFEHRPNSRARKSLYGKYKKSLATKDIITVAGRLMSDNWGVVSQTFDFTYRYKLKSGFFWQPHVRYYQQSAADFYRYFLRDTDPLPTFASADYRLGEMNTTTLGIKFGRDSGSHSSWSARLEYYQQSGNSSPASAFGQLTQQDLYPDVNAMMVQFNYRLQW